MVPVAKRTKSTDKNKIFFCGLWLSKPLVKIVIYTILEEICKTLNKYPTQRSGYLLENV